MSILSRIGNIAKGKWLVSKNGGGHGPAHESALERELAETPRAKPVPLRRDLPETEAQKPSPPSTPIELDQDGHVKRTL